MKIKLKPTPLIAIVLSFVGLAVLIPAHAQETGTTDSIVAIAADSQSVPKITATSVPVRGGTYWWVYPGGQAVPAPMLPLEFTAPIYGITSNEFLVDLTGGTIVVTPHQLAAESQTADAYAAAVAGQVQGLIELITWIQTPAPEVVTVRPMALRAEALDGGSGFTPDGQTQSGIPYLTIAPTNSNSFLITVWNDQSPAIYEIWWTPALANPDYPWQQIAIGASGQTNFIVPMTTPNGFFRAIWDTNGVPSQGLVITIDTPLNGTVIH